MLFLMGGLLQLLLHSLDLLLFGMKMEIFIVQYLILFVTIINLIFCKLLSVGMDNASNCNKLAEMLPRFIPTFHGPSAFMSFFFAKCSPNKKTNVSNDILVVEHEDIDTNEVLDHELEIDDTSMEDDDGHAIHFMRGENIIAPERERKEALLVMPKVSGLARRINDSPTLHEEFDKLVGANSTRWNSDFQCLVSYMYFRKEVEQITAATDNDLTEYQLTPTQWGIVKDLIDALEIFKDATDLFSQKEVPLIMDVLPIFFDIQYSLTGLLEDKKNNIQPLLKVAAKAALLMIDKYTLLTTESEVYYIAIDRKLDWFKDCEYSEERITEIKELVIK
ncbi:hypothetical protein BDQ17DRAFT_1329545 [Cyathus striatus]|nr:hypothetical protein BDQ17DRAFT_1329545 [Cyathus striatus]